MLYGFVAFVIVAISLLPSGPSCFLVGSPGGRSIFFYYLFEFNDFAGSTRRSKMNKFLFILYIYYKIFPRLWQELFP